MTDLGACRSRRGRRSAASSPLADRPRRRRGRPRAARWRPDGCAVTVRAAPATTPPRSATGAELAAGRRVRVVADPAVEPGGCVAEGAGAHRRRAARPGPRAGARGAARPTRPVRRDEPVRARAPCRPRPPLGHRTRPPRRRPHRRGRGARRRRSARPWSSTSTGDRPAARPRSSPSRDGGLVCMPFGDAARACGPARPCGRTGGPLSVPVGRGAARPRARRPGPAARRRPVAGRPAAGAASTALAPHPLRRARVDSPLALGVRALDTLMPVGRGQRLGIFAGSGVGKSSLLSMIARGTEADVTVIALVGERGREVREFLENDLGPEGLARSVVVVATSDEPRAGAPARGLHRHPHRRVVPRPRAARRAA